MPTSFVSPDFMKLHGKIVRKLERTPKLRGCNSIAVSQANSTVSLQELLVVIRTDENLTEQMLSVPEQQYPLSLYEAACKVYRHLRRPVRTELLGIHGELLFMAGVETTARYGIEDIGARFNHKADIVSVPLVKKGSYPGEAPGDAGQWHNLVAHPPYEQHWRDKNPLHRPRQARLLFLPDWNDTAALSSHALRIAQMSEGWIFQSLSSPEALANRYRQERLENILKQTSEIIRW